MIEKEMILAARDEYSKFKGMPFRPGQGECIEYALNSGSKIVVACAPTGCLAWDSIISYNRATLGRKDTIANLCMSFMGVRKGSNGRLYNWDPSIRTYVRSYNGSTVQLHEATQFMYSGIKELLRLELEDGVTLRATPDHKIMTTSGWIRMDKLDSNHMVLCDSHKPKPLRTRKPKTQDLFVCNLWNHPYATKVKTSKDSRGYTKRVEIHRAIYECFRNGISMDEYKARLRSDSPEAARNMFFVDPCSSSVHHKDFDHYNNDPSNLELLDKIEHNRLHGNHLYFNQGIPVSIRVKSVIHAGWDHTYDICTPEYENFIANGIIVHNSGKSLLGMTVGATQQKFMYLCSSKQLQNQIIKDFPEAESIKGRANYPCIAIPGLNASQCIHTKKSPCDLKKQGCPYEIQKERTLNHKRQILNYVYFLTEANYIGRFSGYPVILADEADVIEGTLSGLVGLSFNVQQMYRLGIPAPQYSSFNAAGSDAAWKAWCTTAMSTLMLHIKKAERSLEGVQKGSDTHLHRIKELQHLADLLSRVERFKEAYDETWIVEKKKKAGQVVAWNMKPVWLNQDLAEKYFWRHGSKFILMSATFPHRDVLAELLGLKSGDIDMVELPSTFPASNRPVNLMYTCDMRSEKGAGIGAEEIAKMKTAIKEILSKHKGEKGLIHTVNWKLNQEVMDIGDDRLITHDALNKMSQLKIHLESGRDTVFVSPSSTRGLDLPGDECRFNIIAKCPYKSLGDKLVSTRVYGSKGIGQYWYRSICAQDIVQSVGRGVRFEDDWCVSYVLDKQACNLIVNYSSLFPKYFMDAVDVL